MGVTIPSAAGEVKEVYEEISNSLRFNDGDSPRLTKTPSGAGNRNTWTFSAWVKKCMPLTGGNQRLIACGSGTGVKFSSIEFDSSDRIRILEGTESGSATTVVNGVGNNRDPSAWYHVVVKYDSTQGTAADRIEIYLNGVEVTYSSTTYPAQNYDSEFNNTAVHTIGASSVGGSVASFLDGYMTEVHLVDGAAKAPTDFGEFDDNGVWIPKRYTGTYGTNGFFMQFKQTGTSQNSSGIGADTSGNDNHYAVTNLAATDVTEDTCTNNFATFSPLGRTSGTVTLSEGNCKIEGSSDANASGQHGTIAVTSGKWYLEMKATDSTTTQLGFLTVNSSDLGDNTADGNGGMNYHYANIYYQYNNSAIRVQNTGGGTLADATVSGGSNSSLGGFSDGDILMFALDMDNNRAYFGKNGTFFNSGNPANGTNYFSLQTNVADGVTFYAGVDANTGTELNTGNPSFSISSGNTDGKYGNFEYAPPSGYYALCTKRLAEFG